MVEVFCDPTHVASTRLPTQNEEKITYTLLSNCVVVSKLTITGAVEAGFGATSWGKSSLLTPPIVCPHAVNLIISAWLKPCFLKLSTRVGKSCWGSGVPLLVPADQTSVRPLRNGMMGPPQVETERIAPMAMISAPAEMLDREELRRTGTYGKHICWERFQSR